MSCCVFVAVGESRPLPSQTPIEQLRGNCGCFRGETGPVSIWAWCNAQNCQVELDHVAEGIGTDLHIGIGVPGGSPACGNGGGLKPTERYPSNFGDHIEYDCKPRRIPGVQLNAIGSRVTIEEIGMLGRRFCDQNTGLELALGGVQAARPENRGPGGGGVSRCWVEHRSECGGSLAKTGLKEARTAK